MPWNCNIACDGVVYRNTGELIKSRYKVTGESLWKLLRKFNERRFRGDSVEDAIRGLTKDRRHKTGRVRTPGMSINSVIVVDGVKTTVRKAIEKSGITYTTFRKRVKRGWNKSDAASMPSGTRKFIGGHTRFRYITHNGETHNIAGWSRIIGIAEKTIQNRIKAGWPEEELLHPIVRGTGHYLHPNSKSEDAKAAEAAGLSLPIARRRQKVRGISFGDAISYPKRQRNERLVDSTAERRRRELASLGIII